MLTKRQKILFDFLKSRIAAEGVAPTVEEMKVALGAKSKSSVHALVTELVEKGAIRRIPNHARAIEIVRDSAENLRETLRAIESFAGRLCVRWGDPEHRREVARIRDMAR